MENYGICIFIVMFGLALTVMGVMTAYVGGGGVAFSILLTGGFAIISGISTIIIEVISDGKKEEEA